MQAPGQPKRAEHIDVAPYALGSEPIIPRQPVNLLGTSRADAREDVVLPLGKPGVHEVTRR